MITSTISKQGFNQTANTIFNQQAEANKSILMEDKSSNPAQPSPALAQNHHFWAAPPRGYEYEPFFQVSEGYNPWAGYVTINEGSGPHLYQPIPYRPYRQRNLDEVYQSFLKHQASRSLKHHPEYPFQNSTMSSSHIQPPTSRFSTPAGPVETLIDFSDVPSALLKLENNGASNQEPYQPPPYPSSEEAPPSRYSAAAWTQAPEGKDIKIIPKLAKNYEQPQVDIRGHHGRTPSRVFTPQMVPCQSRADPHRSQAGVHVQGQPSNLVYQQTNPFPHDGSYYQGQLVDVMQEQAVPAMRRNPNVEHCQGQSNQGIHQQSQIDGGLRQSAFDAYHQVQVHASLPQAGIHSDEQPQPKTIHSLLPPNLLNDSRFDSLHDRYVCSSQIPAMQQGYPQPKIISRVPKQTPIFRSREGGMIREVYSIPSTDGLPVVRPSQVNKGMAKQAGVTKGGEGKQEDEVEVYATRNSEPRTTRAADPGRKGIKITPGPSDIRSEFKNRHIPAPAPIASRVSFYQPSTNARKPSKLTHSMEEIARSIGKARQLNQDGLTSIPETSTGSQDKRTAAQKPILKIDSESNGKRKIHAYTFSMASGEKEQDSTIDSVVPAATPMIPRHDYPDVDVAALVSQPIITTIRPAIVDDPNRAATLNELRLLKTINGPANAVAVATIAAATAEPEALIKKDIKKEEEKKEGVVCEGCKINFISELEVLGHKLSGACPAGIVEGPGDGKKHSRTRRGGRKNKKKQQEEEEEKVSET